MSNEEIQNNDISPALNDGKPLFSLQVDDVLIQEIFQKFAEQLKEQTDEIAYLKSELNNRPKMEDFVNLSEAVVSLQKQAHQSSEVLKSTVNDFQSSIEQRSQSLHQILQTKINDMLFSVNAAIRGELETLEKTPVNTKQAIDDVHEMKLQVAKMSQKLDDLKETVIQMTVAYDGEMKFETLKRKTVPTCIENAAKRDRAKIQKNTDDITELSNKLDSFIETFNRILPYHDSNFPQFNNKLNYNRKEMPSYPPIPTSVLSFDDFASYVCDTVPMLENVTRELYSYISNTEAKANNALVASNFETFQTEIQKTLSFIIEETDDYRNRKNNFVTKEDFQNLSDHLFEIVNGASNSSATNMRCIACGKLVQKTSTARTVNSNLSVFQTPQFAKNIPPHNKTALIQRPSSAKVENRTILGNDGIESMRVEPVSESKKLHPSARVSSFSKVPSPLK